MKRTITIVLIALSAGSAFAEETLLDTMGPLRFGGYGAFEVKTAPVADDWRVLIGGKGGCIINHVLVLGGGGYGQVSEFTGTAQPAPYEPPITRELNLGYGGFYAEYVLFSSALVHGSVSALVGGGGVYDAYYETADIAVDGDEFFIAEPSAGVELNVTRFFRVNLSGGYRFTSGLDYAGVTDDDLRGPSAGIAFKFGKF